MPIGRTPPPKPPRRPSPSSVSAPEPPPTVTIELGDGPLASLPVDFDIGSLAPEPSTAETDQRVAIAMRVAAMIDVLGVDGGSQLLVLCSGFADLGPAERVGWSELACLYADASPEERALLLRLSRALLAPS
jgi:hypothetical protein